MCNNFVKFLGLREYRDQVELETANEESWRVHGIRAQSRPSASYYILTPPSSPPCHERQFLLENHDCFCDSTGRVENESLFTWLIYIANLNMAQFIPRGTFPHYGAIPRSYFLGHHRAGLTKMKNMLSSIDYVVECRDSRAPVTSINPMFEEALGKTRRLIVYTKRDLSSTPQSPAQKLVSRITSNPNNASSRLT